MHPLQVTFDLPEKFIAGLLDGSLVRNGGVIQDASGRVVMWLRELQSTGVLDGVGSLTPLSLNPVTGVLNLLGQGINAGISIHGFNGVNQRLDQVQGLLSLTTAASMLNLGVSVIGFSLISARLKELEDRLGQAQVYLEKINEKIDLSFYANFRAALDLAANSFSMSISANRQNSALTAINRFLEAEHVYCDLVDRELTRNSQIGDEYLLTLCFAYISEARCYLELGELDTAARRFEEGKVQIHSRMEKYIDLLLTSKPILYLHPELKEQISLKQLTKIFQWKNPSLDESSVFDLLRDGLIPHNPDLPWNDNFDRWVDSLPASIIEKSDVKKGFWGVKKEGRDEIIKKLPSAFSEMESMIETSQRFCSYNIEIKAISKLGITFQEWLQLQPSEELESSSNLMFVIPEEPISIT